ncbi:hypothetical protein VL15_09020 [Burkholderia cepacia]|uniref:Uncharacterized protein n=1 Tax=Burkholderia cepacia TaxID=292 RepID=A0A0J5X996_BURCE|nr:hypothetical protein VL15_09020 [Burkholderia cepacia]
MIARGTAGPIGPFPGIEPRGERFQSLACRQQRSFVRRACRVYLTLTFRFPLGQSVRKRQRSLVPALCRVQRCNAMLHRAAGAPGEFDGGLRRRPRSRGQAHIRFGDARRQLARRGPG